MFGGDGPDYELTNSKFEKEFLMNHRVKSIEPTHQITLTRASCCVRPKQ